MQNQLTELEGKKTEGSRLVATPEMTKAIEDLRTQQVKFRAERREIRKSLREGIEALENRLLLLNLFSTPAPRRRLRPVVLLEPPPEMSAPRQKTAGTPRAVVGRKPRVACRRSPPMR